MRQPGETDFVIRIDFDRNAPDPGRVFRAAEKLIVAFEALDREFVSVLDHSVSSTLLLHDVEAGSIRIWLRNLLVATDDQALKELDWKPAVGKYLVQAKYAALEILDGKKEIRDIAVFKLISEKVASLAAAVNIRHLPAIKPPSIKALAEGVSSLIRAQAELSATDLVSVETYNGALAVTLPASISPVEQLVQESSKDWPPGPMILKVKRPDYLGVSKWEFRHGKSPVFAKIEDDGWLSRFRSRDPSATVRPGDALRCLVSRSITYDGRGEVLADSYTIIRVDEVIEGIADQLDLLDEC